MKNISTLILTVVACFALLSKPCLAQPGIDWELSNSSSSNNWRSVAYGNGLFVAVANSGVGNRVMTSPDGNNWTVRNSAADNNWLSVCYGNGLFVAVAGSGVGNRVMTSTDGIVWTSRTSARDNKWLSVTYGNGLFVAVSSSGTGTRVMTSPNGITWTARTSAVDNDWSCVTYGNGLFVAVANTGFGNRVMTSTNGINWISQTSASDNNWRAVTFGNGLFVAVASSGDGNKVMTSADGIVWTGRNAPNNGWRSIAYANGVFVAVSGSGVGNRVMTSSDGISWVLRSTPADNNWISITYGNELLVAVSNSGSLDRVMTSGDLCIAPTEWYRDVDNDGYGDPFTTQLACIQPLGFASAKCTEPINASVNNILPNKATVTFDGLPAGAYRCVVWFRPAGSTDTYRHAGAYDLETEVQLNGLNPNTEYEWKMRTRCASETGDTSDFIVGENFITLDNCNELITDVTIFPTSDWVRLNWATAPNAAGYKLRYRAIGNSNWNSQSILVPTARVNFLSPALSYEYTLQVICQNGQLGVPSTGVFTTSAISGRLDDVTSKEWAFSIHPNPSNGQFTVTPLADVEGLATVQLFDIAGRTVLTQTWSASEDATLVFDTQLDNGIYMLNITAADGQTFTSRVVIAN